VDPGNLPWPLQVLDAALLLFLLGAPMAVLASAAFTVHAWHARRLDWCFPLTVCCFAVFIAWFHHDPGGLLTWWCD